MDDLSERAVEKRLRELLPTKPRWAVAELVDRLWNEQHREGSGPAQLRGRVLNVLQRLKRRRLCRRKGLLWSA